MLFDTHAHYDDERFDEDRDTLLASMPENNVGLILNPGCDVESSRKAVSYANKYPFVYAAVGIHPENIEDGWEADLETIRALAQNESKGRAIGEIGLDYDGEKDERARVRQQVVLARQCLNIWAHAIKRSWRVHCTSLSSCMTAMRTPTAWRSPVGIRM